MTTSSDIRFNLRLNDEGAAVLADLAALRERLLAATDQCRVALEGVTGMPGGKVLGEWTPPRDCRAGDLPGYVITYTPSRHPLRATMLSMPRIAPFTTIAEWKDAILRSAEEWSLTQF